MTCHYCRASNPDDEHRCRRCGRRLSGTFYDTASEASPLQVQGALATAPAPVSRYIPSETAAAAAAAQTAPAQAPLFTAPRDPRKVIPFESLPGARPAPPQAAPKQPRRPPAARPSDTQQSLDFLPPAQQTARQLKTTVEAVIYCDAPVATKMHRCVAAAADLSMIMIAFGLFLLTFHLTGGELTLNQPTLVVFGVSFVLIAMFYGVVSVLAGSDSPGKRWTNLRLTNFDGFPPDPSQRVLRLLGSCLGLAAAGAGVLWALVDEESLTWQDHVSKTFLTLHTADTNFFRQR